MSQDDLDVRRVHDPEVVAGLDQESRHTGDGGAYAAKLFPEGAGLHA